MLNSLRILLIWLLVLAIPAQGVAAATMLYCGPDHHGASSDSIRDGNHGVVTSAHHQAPDAGPRQHDHATHDHAAHAAQNAESADVPAQASAAGVPDLSPKVKCSVCASCCNAAAITSAVVHTPSYQAPIVPALAASALPVSFITDGPRRPPRSFLA